MGGEADDPAAFADGLLPVADARDEHLVVERLPAFVDDDDRRIAVEPLLDAVEQVEHRRGAQRGLVEDRGHVEPERRGREIEAVLLIVEQPGEFSRRMPWRKPRGEIARRGAPAPAEQLGDMAQAA